MVAKTDEKKEYAAAEFIKWLTASEQNMRFISKTGYLPVTRQAFEQDMDAYLETVEDVRIEKMLTTVLSMYNEYELFTAPNLNELDAISSDYESNFKNLLTNERSNLLSGETYSKADALNEMIK